MGIVSRFFGRTVGEGAGVAIGTATANAVVPVLQELANETWAQFANKPLEHVLLAQGVAQGQVSHDWAVGEAARTGYNADRFNALVDIFDTGPGVSEAFNLWRRELLTDGEFRTALKREGIETVWIDRLQQAKQVILSPAEIANAIQQGFVPGAGILPDAPGGDPPWTIPAETVAIDPVNEAQHSGVNADRLTVLTQLTGLPPGPAQLGEMVHRGIIDDASFFRGIREGHTKTKWGRALLRLARPVLSAVDAANLRLRGWISADEAAAIGALTGYSAEQMQQLYLMRGRPISPTQGYTAWARGAPHPVGSGIPDRAGDFDRDDFARAIRQSDIRPEWIDVLWHNRFAYPSLFQLRRAVESGALTAARALTILRYQRYENQDATALVDSWTAGTGTTSRGLTAADLASEYEGLYMTRDDYLAELRGLGYNAAQADAKAHSVDARRTRTHRNAAIARIQKRFDLYRATAAQTRASLEGLQVPAEAVNLLMTLWTFARDEKTAVLTPAQLVKAYRRSILTRAEAIAELGERGYSDREAGILLDE